MKIRSGFVSNSSSASFIISFKSSLTEKEIAEIIRKSDSYLDEKWDATSEYGYDAKDIFNSTLGKPPEKKLVKRTPEKNKFFKAYEDGFEIYPSTTMFNDWMDVPAWKFVRALSENRIPSIKLNKIIQTEEEYDTIKKETSFEVQCWESESYEHDVEVDRFDSEKEKSKSKKEAEKRQKYVSYEYLSYLSKIGVHLTKDEEVFLAKNHLFLID